MRVTKELLESHSACAEHVIVFAREWPDGCEVSTETVARAIALGMDIGWAAAHLLPSPAWRAYDEARATALRAYEEATAPALRAYEEARATALRAYEEATAPALRAYEEARATAFVAACEHADWRKA